MSVNVLCLNSVDRGRLMITLSRNQFSKALQYILRVLD